MSIHHFRPKSKGIQGRGGLVLISIGGPLVSVSVIIGVQFYRVVLGFVSFTILVCLG